MATAPVSSTPLPTPPSTTDPGNFDTRADAFLGALPTFQSQTNSQSTTTYNNAVEAFNSATTATTKASEASTSASNAAGSASTASTASSTAVTKASEASTSASNAQSYATTATTKAAEASTARDQAVAAKDQAQAYATQQFNATSSTSNSLVAGSLSFTIQAGKAFVPNQYLVITPTSDPSKFMQGLITSYNSSTGVLVITVDFVSASGGPYTAWTFGLIGRKGDSAGRANIMLTGNATAVAGNNYFFQSICTLTMPVSPSNGDTISFSNATGNPGPAVDFGAVKVKGRTVGVVTMDGRNDAATVVYTGNFTTGWGDI